MIEKTYFNLYSCCIPVKGHKRATICDIQRNQYDLIPIALYEILLRFVQKGKSIPQIKEYFNHEQDEFLNEYFSFLEEREYGFISNDHVNLPKINLHTWYDPKIISNAIIDFSLESTHELKELVNQLSRLLCEALGIRFFIPISMSRLVEKLSAVNGSTLRDIEILVEFNNSFTLENILDLRNQYPRIRKLTLYNSPFNKILEHSVLTVIYTCDIISSENCCGVISPSYFNSNTETFIEAVNYNSCLNKKISIDKYGNIKNCPSMKRSFGNVKSRVLFDVLQDLDFTYIWNINKDKIQSCKVCEFRYICQDCRAYITNESDVYSKPIKCKYDPYE